MSRFLVRPATDADNLALCALSKVPIAGQISLSLERCPDYFAGARIQNEDVEINLICDRSDGGRIAAVFGTGSRWLYVGGTPRPVRYLSDVRILPDYQGLRLLKMINNHIVDRETSQPGATVHSVMFSDNDAMLGVIRRRQPNGRGRNRYLWFHDAGVYRTSAVSLAGGERRHDYRYEIRRAAAGDVETMQRFFEAEAPGKELFPHYRFDRLGEPHYRGLAIQDYFLAFDGGELVGITGTWDQQAFKQTRITGYSGVLRWARPAANALSWAITGFALPPAGTELRYFYLHTIVTRSNSVTVFQDLVEHIYANHRRREHMYFLAGLFTHDPLIAVLDSFRSRRDITAQHYQVGAEEPDNPFAPDTPMYVEAARL